MSTVLPLPANLSSCDSGSYQATAAFRANDDAAMPHQEQVDASQAVAAYRRMEAAQEIGRTASDGHLEFLSIDDLRQLAAELHIPDRGKITDKWELLEEIRRRM